ncbi:MAG: NrsF family protein [Roseiarcus sp.]|jgi:hypothetical protein
MKTSQLIDALVADRSRQGLRLGARFFLALGAGALVSACLFFAAIGPRPDIVLAAHTLRFDLKFMDALALALPSALLALRLLRPDARPGALALAFLAPFLLLGAAVVTELALVPADLWGTRLIGSNAVHCLTIIPLLSIAPLAALLMVMREGAPQNPRIAGALAGAAAAGIAATLYASNCPDDSPLFVASWYPLATLIAVAAGAFAGDRLLRW